MSDFKDTINSKLKSVHSNASLQLFRQLSNFIETSLAQSFALKEEERLQNIVSVMLKVNSFLNAEINNESVRNIIKENLVKDYELFLNPPELEKQPAQKSQQKKKKKTS